MNNGYLEEMAPEGHPHARKNGFIYAHFLVAEKLIGRYLEDGEEVHHIDHVRTNNDPKNLIVFKSKGDHTRFHGGETPSRTKENFVYTCGKDKVVHYCVYCGVPIGTKATVQCYSCFRKFGGSKNFTKEEVIDILKTHSLKEGAVIINVTEDSLRMSCRRHKIPFYYTIAPPLMSQG